MQDRKEEKAKTTIIANESMQFNQKMNINTSINRSQNTSPRNVLSQGQFHRIKNFKSNSSFIQNDQFKFHYPQSYQNSLSQTKFNPTQTLTGRMHSKEHQSNSNYMCQSPLLSPNKSARNTLQYQSYMPFTQTNPNIQQNQKMLSTGSSFFSNPQTPQINGVSLMEDSININLNTNMPKSNRSNTSKNIQTMNSKNTQTSQNPSQVQQKSKSNHQNAQFTLYSSSNQSNFSNVNIKTTLQNKMIQIKNSGQQLKLLKQTVFQKFQNMKQNIGDQQSNKNQTNDEDKNLKIMISSNKIKDFHKTQTYLIQNSQRDINSSFQNSPNLNTYYPMTPQCKTVNQKFSPLSPQYSPLSPQQSPLSSQINSLNLKKLQMSQQNISQNQQNQQQYNHNFSYQSNNFMSFHTPLNRDQSILLNKDNDNDLFSTSRKQHRIAESIKQNLLANQLMDIALPIQSDKLISYNSYLTSKLSPYYEKAMNLVSDIENKKLGFLEELKQDSVNENNLSNIQNQQSSNQNKNQNETTLPKNNESLHDGEYYYNNIDIKNQQSEPIQLEYKQKCQNVINAETLQFFYVYVNVKSMPTPVRVCFKTPITKIKAFVSKSCPYPSKFQNDYKLQSNVIKVDDEGNKQFTFDNLYFGILSEVEQQIRISVKFGQEKKSQPSNNPLQKSGEQLDMHQSDNSKSNRNISTPVLAQDVGNQIIADFLT